MSKYLKENINITRFLFFKEEILKRNQMLKMKNISSEMKQSLDRTKSISDTEEEKISEVEDRLIKIFQS